MFSALLACRRELLLHGKVRSLFKSEETNDSYMEERPMTPPAEHGGGHIMVWDSSFLLGIKLVVVVDYLKLKYCVWNE